MEKGTREMNNEPVAWMVEDDEDRYFLVNGKGLAKPDDSWKSVIPLYTHLAKTLTDEEWKGTREMTLRWKEVAIVVLSTIVLFQSFMMISAIKYC